MYGPARSWICGSPPRRRASARTSAPISRTCSHGDFAEIRGRGGPGDEHSFFDERLAWERRLGRGRLDLRRLADGVRRPGPAARPCRSSSTRSTRRAGGPGRSGPHRRGPDRPDAHPLRFAGAAGAVPAEDPTRRRAVVPGLLRAQRRLRPRQRRRPVPSATATMGHQRPEGVDVARPVERLVLRALARTDRDAPKHKGISFLLVPMDAPGIEIRPIVQITGTSEFNEVFFDGRPHARRPRRRRRETRMEGGDGPARVRARRVDPWPAVRVRARVRRDARRALGRSGRTSDPVFRQRLASSGSRLEIMRWNSLRMLDRWRTSPSWPARPTSPSSTGRTLHRDLGELTVDVSGAEALRCCDGASVRAERRRSACSCTPAPTRSTAARTRSSATSSASAPSACRPNRRSCSDDAPSTARLRPAATACSRGKAVVVTAAAGTGIGFAVAQALPRGRRARADQRHPRTPARRGRRRASRGHGRRAAVGRCATSPSEDDVDRLFDAAVSRARAPSTSLMNNAGLGGTADLIDMTDEQWIVGDRRDAQRHVPGNSRRAAPHDAAGLGRDRQQRVGGRLAGAGRARPTTRRPKPASWRSRAARRSRPPRRGVRINAVAPSLAMHPFLAKVTTDELLDAAHRARGLRPRRRAVGGRQRHGLPRQRLLLLHDGRGRVRQQPAPLRPIR